MIAFLKRIARITISPNAIVRARVRVRVCVAKSAQGVGKLTFGVVAFVAAELKYLMFSARLA